MTKYFRYVFFFLFFIFFIALLLSLLLLKRCYVTNCVGLTWLFSGNCLQRCWKRSCNSITTARPSFIIINCGICLGKNKRISAKKSFFSLLLFLHGNWPTTGFPALLSFNVVVVVVVVVIRGLIEWLTDSSSGGGVLVSLAWLKIWATV